MYTLKFINLNLLLIDVFLFVIEQFLPTSKCHDTTGSGEGATSFKRVTSRTGEEIIPTFLIQMIFHC